MSTKKYAVWWFSGWELIEQAEWLEDLAQKGWHLKSITAGFIATFVKGEAQNTRYRCEVADRIADEQIELYGLAGWNYVDTRGRVHIFCAADSADIPEIHTDLNEQSRTLLTLVHNLAFGIFLFLFLSTMNISAALRSGTFALRMILEWQWTTVLKLSLVAYLLVQSVIGGVHVYRNIRRLRRGLPITQGAGYCRVMNMRRNSAILIMLIWATSVIGDIGFASTRHQALSFPSVPEESLPVVKLGEFLEYVGYDNYESFGNEEYTDWAAGDPTNYYRFSSSFLAPDHHELYQTLRVETPAAEHEKHHLEIARYDTRYPTIARLLAEQLSRKGLYRDMPIPEMPPSFTELYSNLDAVWLHRQDHIGLAVLLSGKTVFYIRYYGSESIDMLIDLINAKTIL